MKKVVLFFTMLITLNAGTLSGQGVKNVTSEVRDGLVQVHYTLTGKFYQTFTVSLYVSSDSGKTFLGPLREVSGETGKNIQRGNHTITWDVMKEMPLVEESLVFDVRAEISGEKPKSSVFVQYVGNPTTYIGLRAGMLGIVGFYGEIRGNFNAFKSARYNYKDGILNYNQPGYYIFSDQNGYSAFSALGGITYQPAKNIFLYLGAGYGKEDYLVGFDTYDYTAETKTGSETAKYDGFCTSGVEVDLGMMVKIKWFLISAGITTINVTKFNWTAGLGVCF